MTPERLAGVRRQMQKRSVDALLITNMQNVTYLSRFTGSIGSIIITPDRAILHVDGRYVLQATTEAKGYEVREHSQAADPLKAAAETINELKPARVGFEGDYISYSSYVMLRETVSKNIELVSLKRTVEEIKIVKDAEEIEMVKKAAKLADECFSYILTVIKPGMTERDAAYEIGTFMHRQGSPKLWFNSIVAAGPNAAVPHHAPTDDVLKKGQMVKLDYGATVGYLGSDITRTIFLGQPDEKQKEVYNTVLQAQLKALAAIKPGKLGREIDAVARDYIASKGYGEYFIHNLGHQIQKADGPGFTPESETVLSPGMIITVEPGIYIEGWGGVRIEDDILVTENGCEILTKSTKEIVVIE